MIISETLSLEITMNSLIESLADSWGKPSERWIACRLTSFLTNLGLSDKRVNATLN